MSLNHIVMSRTTSKSKQKRTCRDGARQWRYAVLSALNC